MRRQRLNFDQFIAYIYTCNKGESRIINASEWNRSLGIEDHDPDAHLLNPITVFTKGSFTCYRGDTTPFPIKAGDGGWPYAATDEPRPFQLICDQQDGQYHCLFPRDHKPRYWHRQLCKDRTFVAKNEFIYVASGTAQAGWGGSFLDNIDTPKLLKVKEPQSIELSKNAIAVRMWTDDV